MTRALAQRHHAMVVGRGLYLLRYVSAPAHSTCPSIAVNQHPSNNDITLIAAPGGSETHLETPGDCLVVRADQPGSLSLVATAADANGAIDAEVRLERIAAALDAQEPSRPHRARGDLDDVSILAHVSRRGDVVVAPGEWIGGPDLPLPIEGLEIRWPRMPDGVELNYAVVSGRTAQPRPASTGEFAGSRGRAASLTGLELSLSGAAARDYELVAEALFLGAAIASRQGREITFAGPSGREPLVGLRVDIVRARSKSVAKAEPAPVVQKRSPGKVRVYRSAAAVPASPMIITSNVTAGITTDRGM